MQDTVRARLAIVRQRRKLSIAGKSTNVGFTICEDHLFISVRADHSKIPLCRLEITKVRVVFVFASHGIADKINKCVN
jgi:hypothetical protein